MVLQKGLIAQFQKISILPPQKGLQFPGGRGVLYDQKIKNYMKLNWNFQRGGEVLGKIPSVGEEWMFSGTTHFDKKAKNNSTVKPNCISCAQGLP